MRAPCPRVSVPRGWTRRLAALVVLVVLVPAILPAGAPPAQAAPQDAVQRLSRARDTELAERNFERALELYRGLLQEDELDPQVRGEALLGLARCHRELGQLSEAEAVWTQVLDDTSLPVKARERAEQARAELRAQLSEHDPAALQEQERRRLEMQRREKAGERVLQARRALAEGRLELARQFCVEALALSPESNEAAALLTEIDEAMPDRSELLRNLLRFASTTRIQEFLRLKGEFDRLEREGRDAYKAGNYEQADERFRLAIDRIDRSEFFHDLKAERAHLIRWLRETVTKAREAGLSLGPEPAVPDPRSLKPSFQRRFFDLLSEAFTARPDEEDPLVLYEVEAPRGNGGEGLVAGPFAEGLTVTRGDGDLSRAWWAEAWIRENLGTGWSTPTQSRDGSGAQRVLDRFGDLLIVQHRRSIQARIEELLDGFPTESRPTTVDVALVATTPSGGTRVAARLGARAFPRDDGASHVVPTLLLEQCLPLIGAQEGVRVLGTARLNLGGRTTATLEVTVPVDRHPVYDGVPPPPLQLALEDSRFGTWIEVYAEDLVRARGARRGALGVRVTTRLPTGTYVVPRPNADNSWLRFARPMAEQRIEAHRIVDHTATLLLQGMANPFPDTAVEYPGLLLLIGLRPAAQGGQATPVPDPPRTPTIPAGSAGLEEREYDLGPLASEIEDDVLDEDWPQHPASVPLPPTTVRRAREAYLESGLASTWAALVPAGEPSPVRVQGRMAVALLSAEEHAKLRAAVDRLRAQDTTLYEVHVGARQVPGDDVEAWLTRAGAQSFRPSSWLVSGTPGLETLAALLETPTGEGRYGMNTRLLARATQKVAARTLRTTTIVEDLQFWRHTDGTQRQIPVLGTAEEGIVVLVRPELDVDGRRLVKVEAQAAHLDRLEEIRLPELENPDARITVPRHLPVEQAAAAAPLADDEALVLAFPVPEDPAQRIVLVVRVRRLQ